MEANLLPYLAARMSVNATQHSAMATLVSPGIAVTTAHAVPKGSRNREGQNVFWLDFPQTPDFHDVRVTAEAYDNDADFVVLKLENPLKLQTSELVFSAEPVLEGAVWETLCIGPSSPGGIHVHGRVEGIEMVDKRSLIRLSVNNSPPDPRGVSGAPVMVDGKVIGIVWGIAEPEPNEPSKERRSSKAGPGEYWYAVPISAMIESKKTDAFRKLLDRNQRPGPDGPPSNDDPRTLPSNGESVRAIVARLEDGNSAVRAAALQELSESVSRNPGVRAAVMPRLEDESINVRAAAVHALSETVSWDPEVRTALMRRLADVNSNVRAETVQAFSEIVSRDPEVRAAVMPLLEDENSNVRAAAVHALSEMVSRDPEVGAAVMPLLEDGNSNVRTAAVQSFSEIVSRDPSVGAAVMTRLADENSNVRAAAVQALSKMVSRDPEVRAALMTRLADENDNVRAAAIQVLSEMVSTDPEVRARVMLRLEDANSKVRGAAVQSLSALASSDDKVREALAEALRGARADTDVTGADTLGSVEQAEQGIAQEAPLSFELDRESFFGRLSPSSRRALSHAAGMRQYFTAEVSQFMGFPKTESDQGGPDWQSIPLDYLVAGLFENEGGPTRRLFLSKNIDDAKFATLIAQAASVPLPSRTEYSPLKLDKLPSLMPPTLRALQTARDVADKMGAAQIQSRHLLYGVLSIKDNALVKLLADAGVRQEDVSLSETETIPTPVPKSIAFVSADTSVGEDLLGFEADVNALSAIIAAKAIEPPLSIGLFGDWGSGKSFFMGKLENCIRDLTEIERATNGNSAYCSNIVHIWFNAWSYVETDLWASLVTDIFEELARAIEKDGVLAGGASPATAKARLLAAMASARDVVAEEERRRDAAKAELEAVEEHVANLKVTDEELQKKLGSRELLKDAYRAVAKDPAVKAQIDDAAKQLSIPEAQRAAGEMRASLLEIKGIWSALGFALKGWKSTRAWLLAAGVLLAVFVFLWVLLPWALKVNLDSKIAGAAGLLLSAIAWLAPFLKKASAGLAIISRIKQQQQQRINEERTKIEQDSKEQQEGVRQKLSDAEARVDNTKAEIGRLEQTLKEMRADKQLLTFIRERSLSTDYTSRLGTVARARRDFKQLSDLMDRVRNEKQDGSASGTDGQIVELLLPRIDRIVLYIDDLDRCAEDKVVKVLEAVHLLLAFRLFVVIVAVDSRWLLRSLRQHSSAFQTSNGGGTGISDEELAHWESTPLNYLEKIFQIPFYLRPMRQSGFARLVDSVVGEVTFDREDRSNAEKESGDTMGVDDSLQSTIPAEEVMKDAATQQTEARDAKAETGVIVLAEATAGTGAGEISRAMGAASSNSDTIEQAAPIPGSEHHSHTAQSPRIEEANPAALQLREWERDFMKKLHPLISSPRSTKRFVNIYRLMRVSIIDQNELTAFVGDKNGGPHRAALLLLAILTGYPAEATDILRDLLEKERLETWWQYVDELERTWNEERSTESGSLSDRRRKDLMARLRLLRGEIPESQSSDQFVKWASKVAKYSFESGRVLMLLDDEIKAD